jgi:glycosyltransferase involved in cell wall biosynthesis
MPRVNAQRVLILVENLPVPFDRRVWMEATTLTAAGYGVSVICPKGTYGWYEELEGVRIYRYPLPSLGGVAGHLVEYGIAFPATFLLTWLVFFRDGFDVLQSANPPDFFFLIGAVFQLLGRKFVFDHHDLMPEMCETRWTGWKRTLMHALCTWAERATFRTADRVIATNESYREVALTRGGVRPERVVVVRSGPSLTRFQPPAPPAEANSGRPFLVGYLGVMGPNDGVDLLLRSAAHIVHTLGRTDVQFVLVGSGDLFPQLVEMSRALRLDGWVRFTGRIADREMIELLSRADVCVAPDPKDALNDVSTMNKIIEYMALAKPLVAFDLREARVSAGDAAVYATPNDPADFAQKIVDLLAAPERRREMAAAGRRRFETTLAWEHQREKLLGLYRELLGEPGESLPQPGF